MNKIGIDIGGTSIKFAFFDDNSEIIKRAKVKTSISDPSEVATDIATLIKNNYSEYKKVPIGIACAGDVNAKLGTVTADNLHWENVNLVSLLKDELDCDVCLVQDAEAAMLAEWDNGSLKGEENAVFLTIGTGVGGGLIIDGKPYRRIKHNACELGHMITHANGEQCACGEHGCFERYASASALVRSSKDYNNALEIFDNAMIGEKNASLIFEKYIDELCIGIVNVISIFAPDVIAIGGGMSGSGEPFLNAIMKGLNKHPYYYRYGKSTKIKLAKFANDAGVRGAAKAATLAKEEN